MKNGLMTLLGLFASMHVAESVHACKRVPQWEPQLAIEAALDEVQKLGGKFGVVDRVQVSTEDRRVSVRLVNHHDTCWTETFAYHFEPSCEATVTSVSGHPTDCAL